MSADAEEIDAEADAEADAEQDVEEQAEEQAEGEQPSMSGEEMADVPDSLAEQVEDEVGAVAVGSDTNDYADGDANESDTSEQSESDAESGTPAPEGSWGDMYVGTLTTMSNALIEEHGTGGAEPVDEDLARQLHLDEYFEEWMQQRGKAEMDPAQGVMFGTTMFLVAVVGTKTDLPQQLLNEVDFDV